MAEYIVWLKGFPRPTIIQPAGGVAIQVREALKNSWPRIGSGRSRLKPIRHTAGWFQQSIGLSVITAKQ